MRTYLNCLIAFVYLSAAAAWAEEPKNDSITIDGNVVKQQGWTMGRVRTELAKEIKAIDYKSHDTAHTANAAPLLALIKASGLEFDPQIKHEEMRCVVLVEGRDGYVASFSLAEMWPDVGKSEVWLALDRDGKPLEERDQPTSLIVPKDQSPSRAVFGVKSIRVFDPTVEKK